MMTRQSTARSPEGPFPVSGETVGTQAASAFENNAVYFEMMRRWHDQFGGVALEPRVLAIIESRCPDGASILDAGCGEGSATRWLAARHPRCEWWGVDISPIGVGMGEKESPSNASFRVASLRELPFEDGRFDLVFSQSVIEHVAGWEDAIREMHRVLKPGGEVVIRVGNGERGDKRLGRALFDVIARRNRVIHCRPSFELEPGNYKEHMSNFDVQEIPSEVLAREVRRAGFCLTELSTGHDQLKNGARGLKRLLLASVGAMRFWPFVHLGYTTVVVGRKSRACP